MTWVFGLSAAVLFSVNACSSDASSPPRDEPDAARGTGGKSSTGGAPGKDAGTGGAAATCDTSSCDATVAQLSTLLGALGGGISVKSCCLTATTCGIDPTALGSLLGAGVQLPPCVDPSALMIPTGPMVDAGPPPVVTPIAVLDGGVIPVPDGGAPILLDPACPGIGITGVLDMPGCCRPSGTCGASTHTLAGAGTTVPLECASYDEVAASAAASLPGTVIPDDPKLKCDYTLGHTGGPDAGSDAGSDAGVVGTPDAAPPDAGPVRDASLGVKDARPD
ncbi:MAG TPA: hypothetical protein VH062_17680 [Polyangiaceae bacterium]|nr:hypothetical protein [Polyangiaceae bacterium]